MADWKSGLILNKDPDSVLDYLWDWSGWLGVDTISSVSMIIESGLTLDSSPNTTTTVTMWLSGGSEETSYNATCRITTLSGRKIDRSVSVYVSQR